MAIPPFPASQAQTVQRPANEGFSGCGGGGQQERQRMNSVWTLTFVTLAGSDERHKISIAIG